MASSAVSSALSLSNHPTSDVVHVEHEHEQDVAEVRPSDIDDVHITKHIIVPVIPENSALDVNNSAVDDDNDDKGILATTPSPSYELPSFLTAPSTRVRRRSELAFSRPPQKTVVFDTSATNITSSSSRTPKHNAYELQTKTPVTPPALSERPDYIAPGPSLPPTPADIENGKQLGYGTGSTTTSAAVTPAPSAYDESVELELDRPSAAQRAKFRRYARIHFGALCWCFFLEGWNDGTTGPLLPRMQDYYGLTYAIVSLIFVINCIGFVTGATLNVHLSDKFGFGKVMAAGSLCQIVCYAMMVPEGPFWIRVVGYGIAGFGIALQNAGANGFVGSLKKNTESKLGYLHGSYGLGAFAAPLAATYFSSAKHWSFHFLISLGIAVSNTAVLSAVFKFRTQDECMAEEGQGPGDELTNGDSKYAQILRTKAVHYLALFALIYVGVEVTLGGWIVTFIIEERQGGSGSGYISSGFFGGLTAGRILLLQLNKKIGERRALFFYAFICIGLEATIWAVPSLIENAVAVSVIGLLMGPMYPILVSHAKNVLPRWLLTGSIGWIAGIGQAGSAALPLVTGVLASRFGISSLQPFVVAMFSLMVGIWAIIPRAQHRAD